MEKINSNRNLITAVFLLYQSRHTIMQNICENTRNTIVISHFTYLVGKLFLRMQNLLETIEILPAIASKLTNQSMALNSSNWTEARKRVQIERNSACGEKLIFIKSLHRSRRIPEYPLVRNENTNTPCSPISKWFTWNRAILSMWRAGTICCRYW